MAVTDSWENLQFGAAALTCEAGTVELLEPTDGVNAVVEAAVTVVDVGELTEWADELHDATNVTVNTHKPRVAIRWEDNE
ncbi:MAG: hypothetical protein ACLPVY_19475 [Acidimicrobiia bacterium]